MLSQPKANVKERIGLKSKIEHAKKRESMVVDRHEPEHRKDILSYPRRGYFMRNLLHMSSRLEARQISDKASTDRAELRTLNRRIALYVGKTVTQVSGRPGRSVRVRTAASPGVVGHYSEPQVKWRSRRLMDSNDLCAAIPPLNHADTDTQIGLSDAQHLNGENGKEPGAKPKGPGIVVIHGRAIFRDCFVRCLEVFYRDHEVFSFANVAEWHSSKEPNALAAAVIIIVIDSGDASNVAGLEFLETAAANIPVVIVSDVDDLDHIVRTLKSGVRGYIPTSLPFNIAVEAVRLVKAGGTFVPASSFVHDRNEQQHALKTSVLLTERQMKVVEEIRHGKANKQIAYELNMSEHTVKVHLRHIMRKLKAKNRTEVAVLSEDFFAGPKDQQKAGSDVPPGTGPRFS